jgi:hypothetical protein
MTQTPIPDKDTIEQVDEGRIYAYDPTTERFVALEVNGQGELVISGAVSISGTATVQEDTPLDVSAATVPVEQQTPVSVEDSTGTQVNPATDSTLASELVREIATWSAGVLPIQEDTPLDVSAATLSVQEDTPLDVSAAAVQADVTDQQGRNLGKARLMDSANSLIDPAQNLSGGSTTASAGGTGSANAAMITVPDGCRTVTVGYDTSGTATVTVEVSPDGGATWYEHSTFSPSEAANAAETVTVGFDDVRAYIDQNHNSLHIGAKGA